MGKCLSCCQPDHTPTQNGHPISAVPPPASKSPSASSPSSLPLAPLYHQQQADTKQASVLMSSLGDPQYKSHTNGDRKMFPQYSKLPPIRKTSHGDAKCASLSSRDISEAKLQLLFEQYKDPDDEAILADGVERFCDDLEVQPEEFRVLVLAWKFDAETMCRFTRLEFMNGCRKLKVDSIKGIQSKFADMLAEVENKQTFRDLYRWTYKFGLDTDVGQRTLPVDMALSLWRLVFSQNEPPILCRWLDFLEKHPTIRGIPKDTWDMFLNFAESIGDDLSSYDESEAWPSLFDDFVEYENDRQNQNVVLDKDKEEME